MHEFENYASGVFQSDKIRTSLLELSRACNDENGYESDYWKDFLQILFRGEFSKKIIVKLARLLD